MEPATRRDARILIVEDNDDLRETVADLLDAEGYTVTTAQHGAEALEYLRHSHPPHLILLDLMMPVMDGWSFRRQQLQEPHLALIPTVVTTAIGASERRETCLRAHAYLEKPFNPDDLLHVAQRYCP